jgi:hypothetical protein
MKESPREQFRWAAHTGGLATVKPKDYEAAEDAEAASPYALWKQFQASGSPLRPGDVLETLSDDGTPGPLQITKYIGFETAQWYVPELKPASITTTVQTLSQVTVQAEDFGPSS